MSKAGEKMPIVLLIGTLDTKGLLLDYLKSVLESNNSIAKIMDVGFTGVPEIETDISREEVAGRMGKTTQEISSDVCGGIDIMSEGGRVIVAEMIEKGEIDGIIGLGGCLGTIMNCNIMKSMPFGFPKIIISTMPYDIRITLGSSDMMFLYSVADLLGLNPIVRGVLEKATGAVLGMIAVKHIAKNDSNKKNIGVSALGITTRAAEYIYKKLVDKGFEVTVFHANGIGGMGLEAAALGKMHPKVGGRTGFVLAAIEGMFDGIIDLTTHEVNNILFDTPALRDPNRMEGVTCAGVPYIFVPGGLDVITQGPIGELRTKYTDRPHYAHSQTFTHVRVNEEEAEMIAKFVSQKLNNATSPVWVFIPKKGFSDRNREGTKMYNKNVDKAFVKVLREEVRVDISIEECSLHINDEEFADKICETMIAALEKTDKTSKK